MLEQVEKQAFRAPRKYRGITVIEMMVTVTVLGVLLSLAAPSFADFVSRSRLSATMSRLMGDLNVARGEAAKRNAWVMVCPRAAGGDVCTASTDWTNGWLVCYDQNGDGACDATAASDPNPIRVQRALDASLRLTGPSAGVRFNALGSANAAAAFTLAPTSGSAPSLTGQVAASGTVSGITKTY